MKGCRPLTDKEVERFLRSLSGRYAVRDKALFMLGWATGYRVSELLSMSIGDVWQFGQVATHIAVKREAVKGRKEGQSVPLNQKARPYIVEWVRFSLNAGRTPASPLFWSQKNPAKPICRQQVNRLFDAAKDKARLEGKISTHSMRKTFAKRVYDRLDGNIFKVQQAMRHRQPGSTVSYMSFENSEIDAAILD
jgi:integrase